MGRNTVGLVALVGALVAAGVAPAAAGAGDRDRRLPAKTEQAIDAIVSAQMEAENIPGVSILVKVGGKGEYVKSYGTSNLGSGAKMQPKQHLRIASVTKTFTATAVLRLVDQGKLSLDDHLAAFVPDIDNGDEITVRQLLNMTAGVYSFTADEDFVAAFDANPLLDFDADDALAIVRANDPVFAPGTSWQYSDSNYVLLGLIIEKVTGRPVGKVIRAEVLAPLGLHETSYPTGPIIPAPRSKGYYLDPDGSLRDVTQVNPEVAGAAGAMISTVRDLGVYAKAIAEGSILKRKTQQQRLELIDIGASPTLSTGYGLGLFEIQGFLGHTGAILGFSTMMFHLPDKDTTIVVIGNQATNFSEPTLPIFLQIAQLLYPGRFPA